jgi:hypothetical protein
VWTTSWTMVPYLPLRSRGVCRSAALAMAVALHASSVAAQQPDAICPACTVTVEELAVLGTEASGARLAFSPSGDDRCAARANARASVTARRLMRQSGVCAPWTCPPVFHQGSVMLQRPPVINEETVTDSRLLSPIGRCIFHGS